MCIAVWVPKDVPTPKKTTLKRCFTTNDEGAGFAWFNEESKMWNIDKGYMTWKAFWKAFNRYQFKPETQLLIHFRISTSGKRKDPDCTHPFPICDSYVTMMQHQQEVENIIVHNGVVGTGQGTASDTMVAVKEAIDPLYKYIDDEKVNKILTAMLKSSHNRWVIARKDQVWLYGEWEKDDSGVYYSNGGYKEYDYSKYQQGAHYDDELYDTYMGNAQHVPAWSAANAQRAKDPTLAFRLDQPVQYFIEDEKFMWSQFDAYISSPATLKKIIELSQHSVMYRQSDSTEDDIGDDSGDKEKVSKADWLRETEVAELYDENGRVIAICDVEGNIIWDANQRHKHFSADYSQKRAGTCPNCQDTKNLGDATDIFNVGDIICYRCGAVFVDHINGPDAIVEWDYDIKQIHERILREGEGA